LHLLAPRRWGNAEFALEGTDEGCLSLVHHLISYPRDRLAPSRSLSFATCRRQEIR
jgi:hypothetical protein